MRLISEKQCAEILDDFRNVPLASFDHPDRVLATLCSKVPHVTTFNQALLRRHYNNNADIMKWDFEQKGFPIDIEESKHNYGKSKNYIVRFAEESGEGKRKATRAELETARRLAESLRNNHSSRQPNKGNGTDGKSEKVKRGSRAGRAHTIVLACDTKGNVVKKFDTIELCQEHYKIKRISHVYDIIRYGKYSRSVNGYLRWGD